MKKIILSILILTVNLSFGQVETAESKIIVDQFVENYNNENDEAIFLMFADIMKKALPKEKTTEFLKSLKLQAGNITKYEFQKYENGTFASYKTTFDHIIFSMNIAIDDSSKISGLFFKPYIEETHSENVINQLIVNGYEIEKDQAEIIFEQLKSFPNSTKVSIAIIKNGNVSYYGVNKLDDTLVTFNNEKNVFEIGSISKVFTSTLLADFVIKKKIKLKENINAYLDTPFNNGIELSFINLANHTSGLPRLPTNLDLTKVDPNNPYKSYQEQYLNEYLSKYLELSSKGEYLYSNLGAGLLGYTLSKIENDSYENLLQKRIFSKYDMQNSTSDLTKVNENLVRGLNTEGNEIPNWEFSILEGAGGILSTAEDLSKFVIAHFECSNKELKLTRKKTKKINDNMDIGLGWHLIQSESKNVWNWHNGATGGYLSSIAIDTKTKNSVIILSNISPANPDMGNIDKLCFELMITLDNE